ncbi:unnamed protein product [Prorocentrum cordatum]|uniref:Uncharacterized protein n=1 Tax=Prorocentrum cordatum TaxID=2364126 RepID=A0ABN9WNY3_9DINO|nr:unnamed protein product [Polarella glacialis]
MADFCASAVRTMTLRSGMCFLQDDMPGRSADLPVEASRAEAKAPRGTVGLELARPRQGSRALPQGSVGDDIADDACRTVMPETVEDSRDWFFSTALWQTDLTRVTGYDPLRGGLEARAAPRRWPEESPVLRRGLRTCEAAVVLATCALVACGAFLAAGGSPMLLQMEVGSAEAAVEQPPPFRADAAVPAAPQPSPRSGGRAALRSLAPAAFAAAAEEERRGKLAAPCVLAPLSGRGAMAGRLHVSLEGETVAGEAKAQADYEKFQKDTTSENKSLGELVVFKTKAISDAKVELSETQSEHGATVDELTNIAQTISDLHGECDFTLKNFDIRQKARLQEIEAIQAAKAFLSGEDKSGLVRQ